MNRTSEGMCEKYRGAACYIDGMYLHVMSAGENLRRN